MAMKFKELPYEKVVCLQTRTTQNLQFVDFPYEIVVEHRSSTYICLFIVTTGFITVIFTTAIC